MSEKYYGNYIGIVISDPAQDPEKRNRAQVWVPSITNTLYKGWNDTQNDKDRSNLSDGMIDRLRNSLPWAECASPLIGGGTPFFSNSTTGIYDSDPAATVVNEDQNLNTEEEPIDTLPPVEMDLSMPVDDAQLNFGIPIGNQNLLIDPEPDDPLAVPSNENVTVDGPIFPDTPRNNRAGSGSDLPPVEPPLPEDDAVVVPSTPTVADQTGEPQTPAQTKPNVPVLNKNYTLDADSAAYKPDQKLLNDVYNTARSVYGEDVVLNIYSAGRSGGSGRHEGGRAIDFYVTTPNQSQPLAGDQLAPLVQAWRAQGYNVGFGMTPQRDGRQTGLHFDNRTDRYPKWAYSGGSWINYDQAVRSGVISPAIDAAFSAGESGQTPEGVDPTALASSDTSTPSVPNDYADANSSVPYGGAGTATGTFSTISYLAKVWVFFYGGDIQRPVYFAQVTNPSSISQALQNNPNLPVTA